MRRCALTRFMPTDCGLKPPIDVLPQMAHMRAMVRKDSSRWGQGASFGRAGGLIIAFRARMNGHAWDGHDLLAALRHSTATLQAEVDEVDALNVFPIPDGDTGSNMLATLQAAIAEAEQPPRARAFGDLGSRRP